jgi:hypothetical protein
LYQTNYIWNAGPNQAGISEFSHLPWQHMTPTKNNPVGFYCLEDPAPHFYGGVLGLVLCWGRTVVHEQGWRSEFAMPLALIKTHIVAPKFIHFASAGFTMPGKFILSELDLSKVAKQYGIPLVNLEDARKIIQEWNEGGGK